MKAIFNGRSGRWFTASVIMLIIAAAVAGFYNIENSNLNEELKEEHLHAETLFSNKVVLQKELEGLRREIIRLEFEGKTSQAELDRLKQLLASGEAVLNQKSKSLDQVTQSLEEIRLKESEQAAELVSSAEKLDALRGENDQLRLELAELKQAEVSLRAELQSARKPRAAYFRIEALKGRKGKGTNRASRTDQMLVSFTWPEAAHGKNLYLVLSGPDDRVIGDPAKEQVSILLDGTFQLITPTVSRKLNINNDSQRQEVLLDIPHKLKAGMYQADVYTDDFHLGGAQIRLE